MKKITSSRWSYDSCMWKHPAYRKLIQRWIAAYMPKKATAPTEKEA